MGAISELVKQLKFEGNIVFLLHLYVWTLNSFFSGWGSKSYYVMNRQHPSPDTSQAQGELVRLKMILVGLKIR